MAVTVDVDGILRRWHQSYTSASIVWRPAVTDLEAEGDALVVAAQAAVEAAGQAYDEATHLGPDVSVYAYEPWMGPLGPVVFLDPVDSAEALRFWLGEFAKALERQGGQGRIEPGRGGQSGPISRAPRPVLTAVLSFDGWGSDERGRAVAPWNLDDALLHRLADWTLSWVPSTEGSLYLRQGMGEFAMTPTASRRGILRRPDGSQLLWNPDLERMRAVTFTASGRLIVQVLDANSTWRACVEHLRRIVVDNASQCSLAVIRHSFSKTNAANKAFQGWPPKFPRFPELDVPDNYYFFRQDLDHERVPDACGIQLLSDGHLARIRNLSRWTVTTVAPGRHLAEAADLAPWFEHDEPDPDVLAAAREDFADAILWTEPR